MSKIDIIQNIGLLVCAIISLANLYLMIRAHKKLDEMISYQFNKEYGGKILKTHLEAHKKVMKEHEVN
jgi:hypothetical protein